MPLPVANNAVIPGVTGQVVQQDTAVSSASTPSTPALDPTENQDFLQWLDEMEAASQSTTRATASQDQAKANVAEAVSANANDTAAKSLAALIAQQLSAASNPASTITEPATTNEQASFDTLKQILQNSDIVTQEVTPQIASAALDLLNQQGGNDAQTNTLKQIFSEIKDSGVPQTVGAIVAKLMSANPSASPTESAQLLQRALQVIVPASAPATTADANTSDTTETATSDEPATDNSRPSLSSMAEGLLASLFRSQSAPTPAESSTRIAETTDALSAPKAASTGNIYVTLVPLANETTVNADTLDARIPTLALPQDTTAEDSLPEVTLPKANLGMQASTPSTSPTKNAQAAIEASKPLMDAFDPITHAAASSTISEEVTVAAPQETHPRKQMPANDVPTNIAAQANNAAQASQANAVAQPLTQDGVRVINSTQSTVDAPSPRNATSDKSADAANKTEAKNGADNFSLLLSQEVPHAKAATSSNAVSATSSFAPVPVTEQVHVAVARAAKDGIDHITIQLDPGDLGRVEVKMHTNADGQTQISFTVDKPSTLDSLSRGAYGLERALQDSGVKTDSGNMQFNLRQQPQPQAFDTGAQGDGNRRQPQQADAGSYTANSSGSSNTPEATLAAVATRSYSLNLSGNLDIHA